MTRIAFPPLPAGSVLGLNYSGMHDSGIALVGPDGAVLFAAGLERFSREKQDGRPPIALLEGLPWSQIAYAAVSTNERLVPPERPQSLLHPVPLTRLHAAGVEHQPAFHAFLDTLPVPKRFVDHHLAHAASAFYPSGFEEALCLTYDGGMSNCPWFGGLYRAYGESIVPLDRFAISHQARISILYTAVTALLGFTPNKHEGKITGLAAYGQVTERSRAFLAQLLHEEMETLEGLSDWFFAYDTERVPALVVNEARRWNLSARAEGISREDMAATVQAMAEEHILEILARARAEGWTSRNICLSGGLFANVKINQRVKAAGFDRLFVSPPMTDDGTALGAAWQCLAEDGALRRPSCTSMALGPSYDRAAIETALYDNGVIWRESPDAADEIAMLLAKGDTVAVFAEGMEFGPRALGNRSILASASDASINQRLNQRLNRTEFMPFAPMSLMEDAAACYEDLQGAEHSAQFMTVTTGCTEEMKRTCPAVVHVDGTARPQLIAREDSPFIHHVISAYKARTGHKAIVNTSFNIHEEPIVCTPQDAIEGFLESGLDHLYFHPNILASFAGNEAAAVLALQRKQRRPSRKATALVEVNAELSRRLETTSQEFDRLRAEFEQLRQEFETLSAYTKEKERQLAEMQTSPRAKPKR